MKTLFRRRSMLKFALILLPLLFNAFALMGQHDYKKGYIITKSNDTIHGYIDYVNERLASTLCFFKTDSLATPQEYSPEELKRIAIGNYRQYVSKELNFEGEKQKLFLEFLFEGAINLYFYIDKKNTISYFVEKEGNIYELTNDEVIRTIDGKDYFVKSNRYINILNLVIQESPKAVEKTKAISYNPKSFITVAKAYHKDVCDSVECVVYSREQEKLNDARMQIKLGMSFNYSFSRNYMYYVLSTPESSAFVWDSPFFSSTNHDNGRIIVEKEYFYPGAILNMTPGWRTSFQLELFYRARKLNTNNFTLKNSSISLPIIVKRDYWYRKKLSPYIELGMLTSFHFAMNVEQTSSSITGNEVPLSVFEGRILDTFQSDFKPQLHWSILGGFGLSYKLGTNHRLSAGLRLNFDGLKTKVYYESPKMERKTYLKERFTTFKLGYCYEF